jgi:hypothetical protein
VPEGVEALVGLFVPCVGEVEGEHRGCEWGVPQGTLEEPGIDAGCQQRGGVGMPQGRDGDAHCGDPGSLCGCAEGALDTGALQRGSRRGTLGVLAPGGGKEPGRVAMGFPGSAEECQCLFGERDRAIFGALPTGDMDLEALAVKSGDLQGQGCMEPEA